METQGHTTLRQMAVASKVQILVPKYMMISD